MLASLVGLALILAACGSSSGKATAGIGRVSPSCIPPAFKFFGPQPSPARSLATTLDGAILSRFAVFRRSALPSDEISGLKPGGGGLGRDLSRFYELSSYYPAYVRQLTRLADGRRYFVVPAYGRSESVPPAHCFPASVRRALVEEQRRRLVEPLDCIVAVEHNEVTAFGACEPFAAIDEGGRVFHSDSLSRQPVVELVPDGVASVRITYREAPAITLSAIDNAFVFTPPPLTPRIAVELKRLEPSVVGARVSRAQRDRSTVQWNKVVNETNPTRLEWLDGAGRVVRAITAPVAGSTSRTSVGGLRAPIAG